MVLLTVANEKFNIKENSWIAWLAARKMNANQLAIVVGSTVHLHNTTSAEFLANIRWVKHEQKHVQQFSEHGFLPFVCKYLWEWAKHGYYRNKYELEARAAEEA
jgi:hypothetical protein